jgi:hypothetical protein
MLHIVTSDWVAVVALMVGVAAVWLLRVLANQLDKLESELRDLRHDMHHLLHSKLHPRDPSAPHEPYLAEIVKQLNSVLLVLDQIYVNTEKHRDSGD